MLRNDWGWKSGLGTYDFSKLENKKVVV